MSKTTERWRNFKNLHDFFCLRSRSYIGTGYGKISFMPPGHVKYANKYKLRDVLYWPIAWCKFMWYSRHDILDT